MMTSPTFLRPSTVLLARFFAKVRVDASTGCWKWTGSLTRLGYAMVHHNGRSRSAHCVAHAWFVGPVADGLELDHLCRNRWCVNPAHLEAVTHAVNVLRGFDATRGATCKRGHLRTPENSIIFYSRHGRARRDCVLCRRERSVAFRAAHRVEPIQRTHCAHGHAYTEANTRRVPGNGRTCRACHRASEKARRLRLMNESFSIVVKRTA